MTSSDRYHVDLFKISLAAFEDSLRTRTMIPSRRALKEELDSRFAKLGELGIDSMAGLLAALKSKFAVAQVSDATGLTIDYLTLLRREANSYLPNPVPLGKFAGVDPTCVKALASLGITNTRRLFRVAAERAARNDLANETGISIACLDELMCMSDLSRLYGVGPAFARLLYDAEFRTVESLRASTAEDLVQLYEERTGRAADFGAHEIQVTLELAQSLDIVVEL
jgi:hypothetical protein